MVRRSLLAGCVVALLAGCSALEPSGDALPRAQESTVADDSAAPSATAPLPPSAAMVPLPYSYLVYFEAQSWLLDDAAETAIDDSVAAAEALGREHFVVTGHADNTGSRAQNLRTSRLRAEAVADALIARGIARDVIEIAWQGAADPAVAAPPGAPTPDNRRVSIQLR